MNPKQLNLKRMSIIMQKKNILLVLAFSLTAFNSCRPIPQEAIMKGFVNLAEIDPTICISMRYASSENFLGRPVTGYKDHVILLTRVAAERLKKVQDSVRKDGYSLVVYDAYRPQMAVDDFVKWGKDTTNIAKKDYYYPYVSKTDVFKDGYVAERSGHSAGSVVDITIIKLGAQVHPVKPQRRTLTDGSEIFFLDDGTVDMGASFDFFGPASHSGHNPLVSQQANKMRAYLAEKMACEGFEVIVEEWWHFRLKKELEPHRGTFFDFPIEK